MNPLIEVVCQLRFPPVLRIDSEVPADFQERIRTTFPLFSDEDSVTIPDLPSEIAEFVKASLRPQAARKTWKFASDDSTWTVHLTREYIALSTSKYRKWEDFRAQMGYVLEALKTEYQPTFLTRIGLRYQNQIVRSRLELHDIPWHNLLQSHVAAEFSCLELAPAIQEAVHRVLIELPYRQARVNLRHGLGQTQEGVEAAYMIDNDFFTLEKTEVADALDRLDLFNRESGRLFRWCITNQLHQAMGPSPLGE